jgi:hypothetical protein
MKPTIELPKGIELFVSEVTCKNASYPGKVNIAVVLGVKSIYEGHQMKSLFIMHNMVATGVKVRSRHAPKTRYQIVKKRAESISQDLDWFLRIQYKTNYLKPKHINNFNQRVAHYTVLRMETILRDQWRKEQ